jgi:hypothetical protein
VGFGEASTSEMMFGMFEFTAANGVSPQPSSIRSQMETLVASFPPGSAFLIDVPRAAQGPTPSVLHLPPTGEGAWFVPTLGIVNVSPIKDLKWNGASFDFSTPLRLGTGPGPFRVTGSITEDGSVRGSLETLSSASRVPFNEFSGKSNK